MAESGVGLLPVEASFRLPFTFCGDKREANAIINSTSAQSFSRQCLNNMANVTKVHTHN